VSDPSPGHRFYGDLAPWWPLISAPADYEEEATFAASVLRQAAIPVREVLELGSGGGNNALFLKRWFSMTLVDLSESMLEVSRRLNPGCAHQQGDMRTVRLERQFDGVFIHDAICYMTTEADLRAAIDTAFAHTRPGGIAVFEPDETAETFVPTSEHGGEDGDDGRAARYLLWSYDLDPRDDLTTTEFAFVLRDAQGAVRHAHETHVHGLFPRDTWLRLVADAGFRATSVMEETTDERPLRELFVGHRPA
jgi:SAM-dependent methyltransferase